MGDGGTGLPSLLPSSEVRQAVGEGQRGSHRIQRRDLRWLKLSTFHLPPSEVFSVDLVGKKEVPLLRLETHTPPSSQSLPAELPIREDCSDGSLLPLLEPLLSFPSSPFQILSNLEPPGSKVIHSLDLGSLIVKWGGKTVSPTSDGVGQLGLDKKRSPKTRGRAQPRTFTDSSGILGLQEREEAGNMAWKGRWGLAGNLGGGPTSPTFI